MRLAKSTTLKKFKALRKGIKNFLLCSSVFILRITDASAQDNSPYSRYGLGDLVPPTNIATRAMGSISAAYSDPLTVNFNNPASYSSFLTYLEQRSKKIISGRVILDIGINFSTRTLNELNPSQKFTSNNALFSYLQLGLPIKHNWGINFGLRPVSRIDYKIARLERLFDPITGNPIDSVFTEYAGDGGAFLATGGTGIAIKNLSVGINAGYIFGKKDYSTKRAFINDSVLYNNSNHTTHTSFGKIFLNAGVQYKIKLGSKSTFTLGASGNLKQNLNASQDIIRETIIRDPNLGDLRQDSVYEQKNVKGKITYPASYTIGIVYERPTSKDFSGLLIGVDLIQTQWDNYRFYDSKDAVQNSWELHVGAQVKPVSKRNYFSNVDYRGGFFVGKDYININNKNLPLYGVSFGLGLPIPNNNPLSRGQFSKINLALEYNRRGNNKNVLKENLFRLSVGLNFSDLWFTKHKYE